MGYEVDRTRSRNSSAASITGARRRGSCCSAGSPTTTRCTSNCAPPATHRSSMPRRTQLTLSSSSSSSSDCAAARRRGRLRNADRHRGTWLPPLGVSHSAAAARSTDRSLAPPAAPSHRSRWPLARDHAWPTTVPTMTTRRARSRTCGNSIIGLTVSAGGKAGRPPGQQPRQGQSLWTQSHTAHQHVPGSVGIARHKIARARIEDDITSIAANR
jgi:hypothetical protein